MKGFLSIDSKFYKYLTFFADLVILTILWTFCSIFIITIGASTTAMYYVLTRMLSDREGYIAKDFFKSFRQNFVQATFVTVLVLFAAFIIYFNIKHLAAASILFPVQFVLCYELIISIIYVFPILSRFEMKTFQLLKTAVFMANRHLFTTFTCLVVFGTLVALSIYQPITVVVCAGIYGWLTSMMFMNLFRKYIPEMDKDIEHTNAEVGAMLEEEKRKKEASEQENGSDEQWLL